MAVLHGSGGWSVGAEELGGVGESPFSDPGMNRTQAARIGGMDRQTLRDWVHRFNERGPDGLKDPLRC